MAQNDNIQLFEDKRIRTAWDEEKEEWYFSVVDVVAVLTDQPDYQAARNYWKVTKKRLKDEGNETVTACNQLKMTASDGKKRLTDVADTEQLLRIIQSIPSPKAEPFKLWLAQVGRERIEETIDPELTIDRALETYLKKGYTREWINQRLQAMANYCQTTGCLRNYILRYFGEEPAGPCGSCGNCDREPVNPEVQQLTLDGVKFFLTHGHRYSVKYTLDALLNAAYFAGADMVLFGHTHRAVSETMQGLYVVNPGTAGVGALCTYACIETENGAIRTVGIHAIPEA